jgi:hypothetical protein
MIFESMPDKFTPDEFDEKIFIYKNFYPNYQELIDSLESMLDKDWITHFNREPDDLVDTFFYNKLSLDCIKKDFHEKIINFVSTADYWIFSHGNFMRLKTGESALNHNNKLPDHFEYVIAYYVGNFEGGEIVFKGDGKEYKPENNDLIIFRTENFEVKEVTKGTRYSYVDYLIKHPGYCLV